jgi:hypothetical protein
MASVIAPCCSCVSQRQINLSVALNLPERSLAATIDSNTSNFTDGSNSGVDLGRLHVGVSEP